MNSFDYWQWRQQQLSPQQQYPQPPGPNDWTNNIQPDGSIAGAQVTATPRPTPVQQAAGAVGQVGGLGAGSAVGSQLGGMLSGAPPAVVPPSTVSSGIPGATSGYPATEALLQGGSQAGIAQGMSAAAPTTGSGWLGATGAPTGALGSAGAIAAGGLTGYQQAQGIKDVAQGNKLSVGEQATLALPTFGASFLYNPVRQYFTSGKDKAQHDRDSWRSDLVEARFLNPDFTYTDGDVTFDWGKDGNARLPNSGKDPLTGQDWRHYYDVDWSKDSAGGIVAAANPLAAVFAGGDKKRTRDIAGYITNTAMAGGDPIKVIQGMIAKAGMDHDKLYGAIHLMSKSQGGSLDDSVADAYKNGLDQLYGVGHYEGQGSKLGTPDIQPGQKQGQQTAKPSNPPAGSPQQPTAKSSPFVGSPNYTPKPGYGTRVSPGVYKDAKGQTYLSKDGKLK